LLAILIGIDVTPTRRFAAPIVNYKD